MEIPVIGNVTKDNQLGWLYSGEIKLSILNGFGKLVLDGYEKDSKRSDFIKAVKNFMSLDSNFLKCVEIELFQYYEDTIVLSGLEDGEYVPIDSLDDVWNHVRLGKEPIVSRRHHGDKGIYISLECECDWEEEHGLQIVFKNGNVINKLGSYDGHLTNSDAYAKKELEDVIYYSPT